MSTPDCASRASVHCSVDERRDAVRAGGLLGGIDYVEVYPDRVSMCVHFFGVLPAGLTMRNVVIEGGERIQDIQVTGVELAEHDDMEPCLRVTVDRSGDFSTYCLCLVEPDEASAQKTTVTPLTPRVPAGIDPRYACAPFNFRINCPSDLDCTPVPCAPPPPTEGPSIDYLARDFTSFRSLLLDRLALTMPAWTERHLPDIGITLVELLAYVADQLSYKLDSVGTEAYLATARRRISVRRHARLVDYRMHEGCNARTWVSVFTQADVSLPLADLVFATPPLDSKRASGLIQWTELQATSGTLLFEAIDLAGTGTVKLAAAHNAIHFYTWRDEQCCLPEGSVRATLLDVVPAAPNASSAAGNRILALSPGDVLIFEEIANGLSGAAAGADPSRRHPVWLTRVEQNVDPLDGTPLVEIEWATADALPFALCVCANIARAEGKPTPVEIAVARGNVVLVDHGVTVSERNDAWQVGTATDANGNPTGMPLPLGIVPSRPGMTYAAPAAGIGSASVACIQDPRAAVPQIALDARVVDPLDPRAGAWQDTWAWLPVFDLLASGPEDTQFVAENDDTGRAQLRFGDGVCGREPPAGWSFQARYRVGTGTAGNVGREAISWMALRSETLVGAGLQPRNPLPALGGIDPEPIVDVKRYAPHAYGRVLERAVSAADYAQIAALDPRIEGAHAALVSTGSGYESCVALDPRAVAMNDPTLAVDTLARLQAVRRIGHDVRIVPALSVSLSIGLDICVATGYLTADVELAVLNALSNRVLADGSLGFFHPDNMVFGEDIPASPIIAAVQGIDGVAHLDVTLFARADATPADAHASLTNGVVPIAADELPQLDNDSNFPERGTLKLTMRGGK